MIRKSIVVALVSLLAVALSSSVTTANGGNTEYIEPFPDGTVYTVSPDDVVVIRWGWHSCNKGLVAIFLTAIDQHEYVLNDVPLFEDTEQANEHWGPIQDSWKYPPTEECIAGHGKFMKAVPWEYDITDLLVGGENTLSWTISLSRPIQHGADFDGDGRPDRVSLDWSTTVTIIVQEP